MANTKNFDVIAKFFSMINVPTVTVDLLSTIRPMFVAFYVNNVKHATAKEAKAVFNSLDLTTIKTSVAHKSANTESSPVKARLSEQPVCRLFKSMQWASNAFDRIHQDGDGLQIYMIRVVGGDTSENSDRIDTKYPVRWFIRRASDDLKTTHITARRTYCNEWFDKHASHLPNDVAIRISMKRVR